MDATNTTQGSGQRSQSFTYDSLSRIQSWQTQMMGGSPRSQAFWYDSFGNMSPMAGSNPIYGFDPATNRINNLPCAPSLQPYDLAGNQTCDTDSNGAVRKYSFDAENHVSQISMMGSTTPFETYTYSGDGDRVRKDSADGTWKEYVYFGGNVLAEKDQTGLWTDYIYANGKKIAKVGMDVRFHLSGTEVQSGGENGLGFAPPPNLVIRSGDKISWRQFNHNLVGGLNVAFSNGTQTGWQLDAYDGQQMNQDYTQDQWLYRTADLDSRFVGATMTSVQLLKDVNSPPGDWYMDIADITVVHADGTVTPIPASASDVPPPPGAWTFNPTYDTGLYATVVSYNQSNDPISSATDGGQHFVRYMLSDHLGTAQMEFTGGGWPVWKGEFAPFGQELDTQFTANHYKFTGLEHDSESGLDHTQFRQYGSTMGRWMSPDPYDGSMDPANPQSFNRYSYVNNMPLNYTDPTGQNICAGSTALGFAFGGPAGGTAGTAICIADIAYDVFRGIGDIIGLFSKPSFHGSLTPRPSTGDPNWDGNFGESLGLPVNGPAFGGGGIGGFLGLPSGCDFGPCGGGFQAGAAAGAIACQFAEPCGAIADTAAIIAAGGMLIYDGVNIYRGRTNVADTGITSEAQQLVGSGRFPSICAALAFLQSTTRDSARLQKIKATQKAFGCRRNSTQR